MSCFLKIKLKIKGEVEKSDIVDNIWKEKDENYPLWDEVPIRDKECHWKVREIKEAVHRC